MKKKNILIDSKSEMILCLAPEHFSLLCLIDPSKSEMFVYNIFKCDIYAYEEEDLIEDYGKLLFI